MPLLKELERVGVRPRSLKRFSHDDLISLNFDFMGFCWGGYNKPYYQIDCELGTICVVDYQDVYMVRGNREDKLCKITSKDQLKKFINLLDIS